MTNPQPVADHGPRPLDRRSPLPLWAQLFDDLRRRVAAGEFTEEFPAEHRLTGEYEVSRHTVREALRKLRADGLVIVCLLYTDRSSAARSCGWSAPWTARSRGIWGWARTRR